MTAPHAAGVAALLVGRSGRLDRARGGLTLAPDRTKRLLYATEVSHACPQPRTYHYTRITPAGAVVEADHRCAGGVADDGFYGSGIVNAYAAATS